MSKWAALKNVHEPTHWPIERSTKNISLSNENSSQFFSSWWILKLSLSQNTNTTISFLFNRMTCLFEYQLGNFLKRQCDADAYLFFLCSIVAHIPIHICNFVRRQMAIDIYTSKNCPHHCHAGGYTPLYCHVLPKSYLEKYMLGYWVLLDSR